MTVFATIKLELTKGGIFATCEELDKEIFIPGTGEENDLTALVNLINEADTYCNPDTMFVLTEKGRKELEKT